MAATGTNVGVKGKRPPSFPHVHPDRAKKFKKAWIEKAKIKSQWKAQKKKEGLSERSKLDIPVYDGQEEGDDESGEREGEGPLAPLPSPPPQAVKEDIRKLQPRAPNENQPHRVRSDYKGKAKRRDERQDPSKKQKSQGEGDNAKREEDSIRELMRETYSKESLHTFKADPLKRRTGAGRQTGERGRGQPNMKLRMNAMLAKIKQDYA